jgi:hypothetical protein
VDDLAGLLLDPGQVVRTGERLGGHRRLESARAALRGKPRHELTAVRALPNEIGRGDDLRNTLVSRRRPVPPVDGGVGILRRLTVAGRARSAPPPVPAADVTEELVERPVRARRHGSGTGRPRVVSGRAARTRMTVGYA